MRSIAVFATVACRTHGVKSICCADARTATCYAKRMTPRAAGKYPRLLTNGVLWRAAHLPSLDTMLTGVDPYRVLQVVPDAEPEVIQAAYRALARKHHPDVGGSEVQMAMLNAAWETLRDERERERYDLDRKTDAAQLTPSEPSAVNQRPFAAAPSMRPMSPRAHSGTLPDRPPFDRPSPDRRGPGCGSCTASRSKRWSVGAPGGTRTRDLQVRNLALYPLSYGRTPLSLCGRLAEREGFEPSRQVTPPGGLANRCTRPTMRPLLEPQRPEF